VWRALNDLFLIEMAPQRPARTLPTGRSSSVREIQPIVFSAYSAAPSTYSANSMVSHPTRHGRRRAVRREDGAVEKRPRTATARAASEVEVEILTPAEFLDQITGTPRAARELIRRLSQRLREGRRSHRQR
jgi:hypothetical protein